MAKPIFEVDLDKPFDQQAIVGHNRWHPDIPSVVSVKPGDVFRVECKDWTDGQIKNDNEANDVRDVKLSRVHVLSGPIAVEGAQEGDLLVVDLLDIHALDESPWGYTGLFERTNGGGFLTNEFPHAQKAIWDYEGIYATSRHVPHVRFAGLIHTGQIGVSPSASLLSKWNTREKELYDTDPNRVPPLVAPPYPENSVLASLSGADFDRVAREAARTVPARENNGNTDIKNMTRGSRLFLPVFVDGANLSVGDIHFSQGDGEISFCGAVEMAGYVDFHVDLIKGGANTYGLTSPALQTSPLEPKYTNYLAFEGISIDDTGRQLYMDATAAYKRACMNAIEYLKKFGYSGEQGCVILGTAPVEGRISGIVDFPNACCTVFVPAEIFDFDIMPSGDGPSRMVQGDELAHAV
ncbi:MAG: acetamidase/formamidase family protein [Candidatus Dormibacteraeota bacterium]|nr:acetamidase/formamidase family protein [Candidatus Dormibacteraeota bacterium]MBO0761568.1 acetamidase/formamidase family protein [Candidatus Dormibacteraeota bacterium]